MDYYKFPLPTSKPTMSISLRGDKLHADILEVADFLAHEFGSPTQAVAMMCRRSQLFQEAADVLRERKNADRYKGKRRKETNQWD